MGNAEWFVGGMFFVWWGIPLLRVAMRTIPKPFRKPKA